LKKTNLWVILQINKTTDSLYGHLRKLSLQQKHLSFLVLLLLKEVANLLATLLLQDASVSCDYVRLTGPVALLRVILIPKFGADVGLDYRS
jgi:hypothetical protein